MYIALFDTYLLLKGMRQANCSCIDLGAHFKDLLYKSLFIFIYLLFVQGYRYLYISKKGYTKNYKSKKERKGKEHLTSAYK